MPLWKSKSARAFKHNIRTEVRAGRPVKQAVAIAYNTQRNACGPCNSSGMGAHLKSDADDFRYIRKEARDIERAVKRLERRDKGMRNRAGLRNYGYIASRWDRERGDYVPTYDPTFRDGTPNKISVTRIKLDRQGYTRSGQYYGTGAPVWSVMDDNGYVSFTLRAPDKKTAKAMILAEIPNARFYR